MSDDGSHRCYKIVSLEPRVVKDRFGKRALDDWLIQVFLKSDKYVSDLFGLA